MRTRFDGYMKIAAMCCIVVLLTAGTVRLLHTSVSSSHKHGKAVSEVSSILSDHLQPAAAVPACALPCPEIREPVRTQEESSLSRNPLLLRRLRGRAPPAWYRSFDPTTFGNSTTQHSHAHFCATEEESL
jgi:hypothetical protein